MEETIDRIIYTASGEATLYTIEEEDKNGKWNDSYTVKNGFYVVHRGTTHLVYKVNK